MRYRLPLFVALTLVIPAYGVVPIPYVSENEIQLDGQLDDWSEVLGPPLLTASDFHIWQGDPMHEKPLYVDFDPENLDFRIWMGWSTPGRVFVAAEFTDDLVRNDGRAIYVQTDGMAISVTPDGREEVQRYSIRAGDDRKIIFPYPYFDNESVWSSEDPFALASKTDTPTSWTVEFFISCFDALGEGPDDSAVSDLAAGDEIDLTLSVVDWDAHDSQNAWFYLAPEDLDAPAVRALLLSPGDTAVRQQTWGGVKALSETE